MKRIMRSVSFSFLVVAIFVMLISAILPASNAADNVVRVGYFPNITHSQALVGMAKGVFQKELGENVKIEVRIFNAGPSVIETILLGMYGGLAMSCAE